MVDDAPRYRCCGLNWRTAGRGVAGLRTMRVRARRRPSKRFMIPASSRVACWNLCRALRQAGYPVWLERDDAPAVQMSAGRQ